VGRRKKGVGIATQYLSKIRERGRNLAAIGCEIGLKKTFKEARKLL
jgi:hypothetical protein